MSDMAHKQSTNYRQGFLTASQPLTAALESLNATGFKTVMVVDAQERLLGIATDWDIRNALLAGTPLSSPVSQFMNTNPYTVSPNLSHEGVRQLFREKGIESVPVVDAERRVVGFYRLRDITIDEVETVPITAPMVIMAGGFGKRLWPLTETTPKPLLKVADKPILGHILDNLKHQNFRQINLTLHHQADQFEDYLSNERSDDLNINLIKEDSPLGTAGSLKMSNLEYQDEPIFVMNGDILTRLDFSDMLSWHRGHGNCLTMATRHFPVHIPFGVLQTDGQQVLNIEEKPHYHYNINAGIYLIEPQALKYIPENTYYDMPQLINTLIEVGETVGAFPISEAWIDIGEHTSFQLAQEKTEDYVMKVMSSPQVAKEPSNV